jgi:hypothetical protein
MRKARCRTRTACRKSNRGCPGLCYRCPFNSGKETRMADVAAARRRIYLMRHGSVTYFDEAGKPLPARRGPAERAMAARRPTPPAPCSRANGVRFDRVIVSGLPRTVETARACWRRPARRSTSSLARTGGDPRRPAAEHSRRRAARAFTGAFEGLVAEHQRFLGGESVGALMDRVHPRSRACAPTRAGTRCCWSCTAASTARSCRSP